MKPFLAALALTAVVATPVAIPSAASAQRWQGDRDSRWDPARGYRDGDYGRRLGRNDRVYRGSDGRYYCKRSNGTTGLVLGAVGGGVLGNVLGGGTLGTVLGAGGGALLGRHLDQKNDDAQNRRNGYYCRSVMTGRPVRPGPDRHHHGGSIMRYLFAALALVASPAIAEWNPGNDWISASKASSIIASRGYRVSEVKATEHEWLGHAFRSGERYEFRLDPRSGRVLSMHRT